MDNCGFNSSTVACQQVCLSPVTAFQSQNLPFCIKQFNTGVLSIAIAISLNITLRNPVLEIFDDCMSQYCSSTDQSAGGCPDHNLPISNESGLDSSAFKVSEEGLCTERINKKINPDLGGIGVFVSYIMQAGICISIFWISRLISILGPRCKKISRKNPSFASKLAQQEAVFKSIAVEFQEAQCFFMLACQSAVLVVIKSLGKNPLFLGMQTMGAVRNNIEMARLVCLGGILPITFVLWTIHTAGMSSLVICALSGFTIILALSGMYTMPINLSPEFLSTPNLLEKLDKCGHNAPPIVLCGASWDTSPDIIDTSTVIFCASVYLLILGTCVLTFLERRSLVHGKRRNKGVSFIKKVRETLEYAPGLYIHHLVGDLIFNLLFVFYCMKFWGIWTIESIDPSAWSFGQIIAVTIWFQVLTKYLYWSIFGMEGHSTVHIAAPYQITKHDPSLEELELLPEDDGTAALRSHSTSSHDPLPRPSQDEIGEEEQLTFLQRTPHASILHSQTY